MEQWLFQRNVIDWESWAEVSRDKNAFAQLIQTILPGLKVENCRPSTNAVFKVGNYIVKIFAPKESGLDTNSDYETELYGLLRAQKLGILAPKLIGSGSIEDKYLFRYLVMNYIDGQVLGEVLPVLSPKEKYLIGRKFREITDKLNTEAEPFNSVDVVQRAMTSEEWDVFSSRFNHERKEFLRQSKCKDVVFVHGDINSNNVLLGKDGELYLIDFADGLLAPIIYEHAYVALRLFRLDPACLHGFFGDFELKDFLDMCCEGLLLHDFGADILDELFGNVNEIKGLTELREQLRLITHKCMNSDGFLNWKAKY